MSRIRVKKQIEIERNVVEQFLMVLREFIKKYRVFILAATGIILVAIVTTVALTIYFEDVRAEEQLTLERYISDYRSVSGTGDREKALRVIGEFSRFVEDASSGSIRELGYYYIGNMYSSHEKYGEAKVYLEKFIDRASGNELLPLAMLKVASVYSELNEKTRAIEMYRRLENEYDDSVIGDQIFFFIASHYQRVNEPGNAKRYYRKQISAHPGSPMTLLAKKRLFLMGGDN